MALEDLLGEGAGREFTDGLPTRLTNTTWSVECFTDPKKLIHWMNKTRSMPLEAIDAYMVAQTYPAAVWQFRAAALDGNLKAAKSLEMWLTWAKPVIQQMAHRDKNPPESKGSVAFLPREPEAKNAGTDDDDED